MADQGTWTLKAEGDIAVIHFDDGRMNAYTTDGLARFNELLDEAEQGAHSVIVRGRPGSFSAGFDLNTIKLGGDPLDELLAAGARTFSRLLVYPLPVIATCTGHALAAGALMLLASDIRIGAAGEFKIGLHEVAIGSPLPRFLTEIARYRMPPPAVDEILWGDTFAPEPARARGYLDEVVPAEELDDRCRAAAEKAMRRRRGVVASAKRSLRGHVAERMLANLPADLRLLNPRSATADKALRAVASTAAGRSAPGA